MTMWNEFLGNQILISAVLGWTVAQFLKTVIDIRSGSSAPEECRVPIQRRSVRLRRHPE